MKCIHFACLGMAGSLLAGSVLLENIASAGIIEDLAIATILEDFQFDDDEDTLWSAAANSANPGNFLSPSAAEDQTSLADVVTNGAGALSADTKANTQNGRMLVDTPNNVTFG